MPAAARLLYAPSPWPRCAPAPPALGHEKGPRGTPQNGATNTPVVEVVVKRKGRKKEKSRGEETEGGRRRKRREEKRKKRVT